MREQLSTMPVNNMTQNKPPLSITENDVIDWLNQNRDFLQNNPEVCDILLPPTERQGKTIADFQAYMIKRLKDDKDEVIESAREIVETSRTNMSNQAKIHHAVLILLEATTFEDFIQTVTMDLVSLLGIDIISLIVEAEGDVIPHIDISGVRAVTGGTIDLLLQNRHILLESNMNGLDNIYGGGAGLVKSQLLMRLPIAQGMPPVMMAFGSRNPEMFTPGQGTELVEFLGRVIERNLYRWLLHE